MRAGETFKADQRGGDRPHYWIAVDDADEEGRFLAVTLTDARKYAANDDVWLKDTAMTVTWRLEKNSVVAVSFTQIWTVNDAQSLAVEWPGVCNDSALTRARCNLVWFRKQLQPRARARFERYEEDWANECFS